MIICGVVIEKDGKYLLVQEKQERCYGKWGLPSGKWDEGETIQEGAVREAFEETGYHVELTGLISVDQLTRNGVGIIIIFAAKVISGDIKINQDEILDVRWVDISELNKMDLRKNFVKTSIESHKNGDIYPIDIVKDSSTKIVPIIKDGILA